MKAILLLSCPDARGIVADVSHFIFAYGGNIMHSSGHHDPKTETFFMRVEWDTGGFGVPAEKIAAAFEPIAAKFSMDVHLHFPKRRVRSALFVSKHGHCLFDLLLRAREGGIDTDVAIIISNHPDMEESARGFGIPYHCYPVRPETRAEVEQEQIALLREHDIDLIVLARYMRILSPTFVQAFPNQIINIHQACCLSSWARDPAIRGSRVG